MVTGNVGRDPEQSVASDGTHYVTFSVAVFNGKDKSSDWVDVSCRDKLAGICLQFIKKGTKVLVDGTYSISAYINKDNIAVAKLKIYANSVEFFSHATQPEPQNETQAEPSLESDITF